MSKKATNEEQTLFPEAKVGNIIIKPWSFGKLFDVSPSLERVLDRIDEKGISDLFEKEFISYVSMARLFTIASKEVLNVIATTVDLDEEEIRNLSIEDGIKLAIIIFQQNKETIKNALSPLLKK